MVPCRWHDEFGFAMSAGARNPLFPTYLALTLVSLPVGNLYSCLSGISFWNRTACHEVSMHLVDNVQLCLSIPGSAFHKDFKRRIQASYQF